MALLNKGKKYGCKTTIGGIKKVYLATFVHYSRNEFSFDGLVLTSIPTTFIYDFELDGDGNTFNQTTDGQSYDQNLNLEFKKQDLTTTKLMESLNYLDYRALVEDRNGNYFLFGLDNGLTSEGLEITTGGNVNDFNGYRIRFKGREKHPVPFVLDPFDNGFIVVEGQDYYQFQDLEAFLFQDGGEYQFN